jgi:hypothetical protein
MTKGQKPIYKHTHKPKDQVTWTPFMSAVMWEARLLALSRCLASLLVFCGVRVAHLFCFCVMLSVLFLLVICLVCPKLPVSLEYPFVISPQYSPTFIDALFFWNAHRYGVMIDHHKINYIFQKCLIRDLNSRFSHISEVYRLVPLFWLLIAYGITRTISILYCIIPCFVSIC